MNYKTTMCSIVISDTMSCVFDAKGLVMRYVYCILKSFAQVFDSVDHCGSKEVTNAYNYSKMYLRSLLSRVTNYME